MKKQSAQNWQKLAEKSLLKALHATQKFPTLARLGPRGVWVANIKIVGNVAMSRLNFSYRGKNYPTDVLSFPAIPVFRKMGVLGDLVICLPTLKRQALELNHSPDLELEVLIVHGILHLLGMDHEDGPKEALFMARWEKKVLGSVLKPLAAKKLLGLIDRAKSGIKSA